MGRPRDIADSASVINALDGVTATGAELNTLDGITSTTAELNILDGVTSTASEINVLDGVTSTAAELNILDGVTATAAELNNLDAVSRGSLIYGNASAETAILTKGTANQVLTSDGTDIAWANAAAGGTSGWEFISTTTVSSGTALSVDIQWHSSISTYKHFVILFEAHNPWSNGAYLQGYTLYGSNHDPLTTSGAYCSERTQGGSTTKSNTGDYLDMTQNTFRNTNGTAYVGQVMVINANSTSIKEKRIMASYGRNQTGQASTHYRCDAGHRSDTAQITGFRFHCAGGQTGYDCTHGKFHLYGVI